MAKFIRAWNLRKDEDVTGWSIIDTMMNLPILYWASEEIGDPRYRQIADGHAHTVMNHFVRKDGSVAHIIDFDPETGEVVREIGGDKDMRLVPHGHVVKDGRYMALSYATSIQKMKPI